MPHPRIVSLVPSATEMVCLLGAADWLVGRSHECDFPPSVRSVPPLTSPAITAKAPQDIDRQVSEQLTTGASLYSLDTHRLQQLRSDIILTQDLCSVCSIDLATVRRLAETLDPRPTIVSLNPSTVEQVLDDVLTVGAAIGLGPRAASEVVRLRDRLESAADLVNPFEDGPSTAFLEWTDPLYVGGHWTVQLIERAGGRHPLNPTKPVEATRDPGTSPRSNRIAGPSLRVTPEMLLDSRPQRVIICPCGIGLDGASEHAAALTAQPWFRTLPASTSRGVALVDGNQMFNRPGPRLVDAFEWLVGWLQGRPEVIPPAFPWHPSN